MTCGEICYWKRLVQTSSSQTAACLIQWTFPGAWYLIAKYVSGFLVSCFAMTMNRIRKSFEVWQHPVSEGHRLLYLEHLLILRKSNVKRFVNHCGILVCWMWGLRMLIITTIEASMDVSTMTNLVWIYDICVTLARLVDCIQVSNLSLVWCHPLVIRCCISSAWIDLRPPRAKWFE